MADKITREQRSQLMRSVKSKDSEIEIRLRKALWAKGFRYRKHYRRLPGTPDIVFVSAKVAIFCDSEFWHGKDWETRQADFKSNKEFWIKKIERNIARDQETDEKFDAFGWKVLRFWGKEIDKNLDQCIVKITSPSKRHAS